MIRKIHQVPSTLVNRIRYNNIMQSYNNIDIYNNICIYINLMKIVKLLKTSRSNDVHARSMLLPPQKIRNIFYSMWISSLIFSTNINAVLGSDPLYLDRYHWASRVSQKLIHQSFSTIKRKRKRNPLAMLLTKGTWSLMKSSISASWSP